MIITRLHGGLGNQMFQYAAGLALARRNGDVLALDTTGLAGQSDRRETTRPYALSDFKISARVLDYAESRRRRNPYGRVSKGIRVLRQKLLRQYYIDWHPEILARKGDVYLDGYFQSDKYFSDMAGKVRKEFELVDDLQAMDGLRREIDSGDGLPISLHVRRGDYFSTENAKVFAVCTPDYFRDAVTQVEARVGKIRLVVFSDDTDWVKQNLPLARDALFVSGRVDDRGRVLRPSQEMVLMSYCRHNIISNSTFSWWGAYLGEQVGRVVVAPARWNNSLPSPHRNIIPAGWTTLAA